VSGRAQHSSDDTRSGRDEKSMDSTSHSACAQVAMKKRRVLGFVLLSLLLSTLTTCAISAVAVYRYARMDEHTRYTARTGTWQYNGELLNWGSLTLSMTTLIGADFVGSDPRGFGPYTDTTTRPPSVIPRRYLRQTPAAGYPISVESYGWPMRAFAYIEYPEFSGPSTPVQVVRSPHWRIMLSQNKVSHVPYMPLLAGFSVNTAIAVPIWFGLLWVVFTIRTAARRRRGLCAGCGYDLSATAGFGSCPECGLCYRQRTSKRGLARTQQKHTQP